MRVTSGFVVTLCCEDCGTVRAIPVIHDSVGAAEEARGVLEAAIGPAYHTEVMTLAEVLADDLFTTSTLRHLGLLDLESVA